jgi:IS4 transposase
VELFFKWIKQHLKVKSFWGQTDNAVRIQIHVAIITYCLVAIVEHYLKLNRPVVEVMRILSSSLLVKDITLQEL